MAVLVQRRRLLLVRRRNPPDAGLWGCPGGKIEGGETIKQAAARELQEETGLLARPLQLLMPFEVIRRDAEGQLLGHFILLPVLCQWLSGTPTAASDALDAAWFEIDGLAQRRSSLSEHVPALAQEALAQEALAHEVPVQEWPGRGKPLR